MYEDPFFLEGYYYLVGVIGVILFVVLAVNLVSILIFCRIFSKAGYHWTLGLLMLIPVANLLVPFFLAFADWPAQRELRELRQRLGAAARPGACGR